MPTIATGIDVLRSIRLPVCSALLLVMALMSAALAVAPAASDSRWPTLSGDVSIELQDDDTIRASERALEYNEAYATIEGQFALAYESGNGLYATLVFEPVRDASDDRYFGDVGLYAEQLYAAWQGEVAGIRVGKMNLEFGLANDLAPGLYGDDLVGEYELTELLAATVEVPFEALGGEHAISASVFMADRTFLSDSLFTSRGRLRRRDGGVANTDAPASVLLSLSGSFDDTAYTLGLRHLGAGRDDAAGEFGAVAGASQNLEWHELEIAVFGELAYFPDFDGAHDDAAFSSVGIEIDIGDVALTTMYSVRRIENADVDHTIGITAGVNLTDDLTIAVGYRYLDEDGATSDTIGLLLSYAFGFD